MTQHHNILQEIEEDLERQKLEELWKRYGSWVLVAAVLIVLATAGISAGHAWRSQQQQKTTAALIGILDSSPADAGKRIAPLEAFAQKHHGTTQAVLAQLQAAGLAAQEGDAGKAVALYDAIAANTKADPAFRQLADLLAVRAQMDSGDPVILQKRLQPLLADNAPWRASAREDEAFLALRAGDKAKARQLFVELSQDAGAPQNLAARAADMVRFLDE